MRITIYWITRDYDLIRRTQKYFKLPEYMSVNRETEADVSEETLENLRRGEPKYLQIRKKNVQSEDTF